jgi:hypothetical protein
MRKDEHIILLRLTMHCVEKCIFNYNATLFIRKQS